MRAGGLGDGGTSGSGTLPTTAGGGAGCATGPGVSAPCGVPRPRTAIQVTPMPATTTTAAAINRAELRFFGRVTPRTSDAAWPSVVGRLTSMGGCDGVRGCGVG